MSELEGLSAEKETPKYSKLEISAKTLDKAYATHCELIVYRLALESAAQLFEFTKMLPPEEQPFLGVQVVKSSRSVCANLAEAWAKRRYRKAFVAKLNEVESEAAETYTWIQIAVRCEYLTPAAGAKLLNRYNSILGAIARLIQNADAWIISA